MKLSTEILLIGAGGLLLYFIAKSAISSFGQTAIGGAIASAGDSLAGSLKGIGSDFSTANSGAGFFGNFFNSFGNDPGLVAVTPDELNQARQRLGLDPAGGDPLNYDNGAMGSTGGGDF